MTALTEDTAELILQDKSNDILTSTPKREKENVYGTEEHWIWTRASTLNLLDLYNEHRKKIGTWEIKNLKKMWSVIASLITNKFHSTVTPAQCENRWRVLERNYKKWIDNTNKTGRGRVLFEYEKEMDELLGKKKSVKPQILLSSETVSEIPAIINEENSNLDPLQNNLTDLDPPTIAINPKKDKLIRRRSKTYNRNDILEKFRNDKLNYQKEKLIMEKEKINIEKEKLLERKRRNDLLEERNNLIKKCIAENISILEGF